MFAKLSFCVHYDLQALCTLCLYLSRPTAYFKMSLKECFSTSAKEKSWPSETALFYKSDVDISRDRLISSLYLPRRRVHFNASKLVWSLTYSTSSLRPAFSLNKKPDSFFLANRFIRTILFEPTYSDSTYSQSPRTPFTCYFYLMT